MWMKFCSFWVKPHFGFPALNLLFFGVLILSTLSSVSQQFTVVEEYQHIRGMTGVDPLDNIYAIQGGVLYKYTSGDQVLNYSNRQAGGNMQVYNADPLNILVFFPDFGQVVFLDKNLSEKNSIRGQSLHSSDLPAVVCFSQKNGFWAWFPHSFQLSRFDFHGQKEATSPDLSMEYPAMGDVKFMAEANDRVFVAANGIWVFDQHANFLFHIPHIQTHHFQVIGEKVFYLSDGKLYSYDFFLKKETVFLLPEKNPEAFFVRSNRILFLQTPTMLKKLEWQGRFF